MKIKIAMHNLRISLGAVFTKSSSQTQQTDYYNQQRSFWYAMVCRDKDKIKPNRQETAYQMRERPAPLEAYSASAFALCPICIFSIGIELCHVPGKSDERQRCIEKGQSYHFNPWYSNISSLTNIVFSKQNTF